MRWEDLRERDLVTVDDLLEDPPLIPNVGRTTLYKAIWRGQLSEPIYVGRRMYLSVPRLGRALGLIEGDEEDEGSGEVVAFPRAAG